VGNYYRGARPSPPEVAYRTCSFEPLPAAPANFIAVPKEHNIFGNGTYGDCHSSDSEVLTEHGWTPWPEYDGSSLLGTMNQRTGRLEFQAPSAIIRREHDGPMVYADHKRIDFAVTPNHRMWCRPYKIPKPYVAGGSFYEGIQFRHAGSMPTRFLIPGATSGFIGTKLRLLEIGGRPWDGTDFLRLLAVILSDGYASSGETNRNRIGFCCFREDRREMVEALAYRLAIPETNRRGVWELRDHALAQWLRSNAYTGDDCHAGTKRIPDLVKVADESQIEEFLNFFGDQNDHLQGRMYYSSSKRMIDDLQELMLRIGKRGSIYNRGIRVGGKNIRGKTIESKLPAYQLYENPEDELAFVSKNLQQDHYRGEVFCATVPNSTLVTRRNGSVLISGQCVTAEEFQAKNEYMVMLGLPELALTESQAIAWARAHGVLNGATLTEVMDGMIKDGISVGGTVYKNGPYSTVDWTDYPTVTSAIFTGPVKIGVAADQLENAHQSSDGWWGVNFHRDQNIDHCVNLCGYGPASFLANYFKTSLPGGVGANDPCVALYTWASTGILRLSDMVAITAEAWIRNPTTVGLAPPTPTPPTPPPIPGLNDIQIDLDAHVVSVPPGWTVIPQDVFTRRRLDPRLSA